MRAIVAFFILVTASVTMANDAWVGNGGTPRLMNGHPTIRMERESIVMTVGRETTTVEARFWFRNDGPSTTVQMGFPDEDSGREEPGPTVKAVFKSFASWVDGRRVSMKLQRDEKGAYWHTKEVTFPRGKTVVVTNRYTVPTGMGVGASIELAEYSARYTFRTGASWKGTIGRSDLRLTFDRDFPVVKGLAKDDKRTLAGRVYASGPVPKLSGRTLTLTRRNWRPTEKDDFFVVVPYRRK